MSRRPPPPCRHRSAAPAIACPRRPARNLYRCDCPVAAPSGLTTLRHCRRCPLRDGECPPVTGDEQSFWDSLGLPGGCTGC